MGKGAGGGDLMAQHAEVLTVKNTFIEVDNEFFEDDAWETGLQRISRKRQVSEPAFASGRQVSRAPMVPWEEEPHLPGQRRGDEEEEEPESEAPTIERDLRPVPGQKWEAGQCANAEGGVAAGEAAPWPQTAIWSRACDIPEFFPSSLKSAYSAAPRVQGEAHVAAPSLVGASVHLPMVAADNAQNPFALPQGKALVPDAAETVPQEWAETVTVMMRNLPNRYTQQMLIDEIGNAGFAGAFDFLYLPIDPETNANKGYAFINFLDRDQSRRFKLTYEGQQMSRFNSSKFVSVSPAVLQGLEANYAHYSTARCSRGDPSARPLFLREPQHGLPPRAAPGAARRGGQRRRNNGRSLVDVAAQLQHDQQPGIGHRQHHRQQPQSAAPFDGSRYVDVKVSPVAKFCPYCGGGIQPGHRFCQFCGASQANVGQ